jgi:hypothetical protein
MIIQKSSISMSSQYSLISGYSIKESLRINLPDRNNKPKDTVTIEHQQKSKETDSDGEDSELALSPELQMIKMLLEKMTGKKIKLIRIETDQDAQEQIPKKSANSNNSEPQDNQPTFEYSRSETYYQSEKMGFYAKGLIQTDDGKNIEFKLKLDLNREQMQNQEISIGNAKTKDPLIINLKANSAQLTNTKFDFDLDSKAETDQISFVDANSGFLAIDINKDGKINDGKELFGPTTGDGFIELKSHDSDNNNWIDEKDSIYKQLLVWTKDSKGQNSLTDLKQAGVGAIYLGRQSTPFEINDGQNNTNGLLKSSGIYISEKGEIGTIQQVDLVI